VSVRGPLRRIRARAASRLLNSVVSLAEGPDWSAREQRLVVVYWGADYREAFHRLASGGEENYYAQRYVVKELERFTDRGAVGIVCCRSAAPYAELLPNGVHTVGAGPDGPSDLGTLVGILERLKPTHLTLCTPIIELMSWAIQNKVRTIALLAESLRRDVILQSKIALLNDPVIEWVGCYLRGSALQYADLGVGAHKIVPWEWPTTWTPDDFAVRELSGRVPARLVYVGALTEGKGVGDALQALAELCRAGTAVQMSLYGEGDDQQSFRRLARRLGIARLVEWGGVIASSAVPERMRQADLVVIPSRPTSPEGLPLVLDHSLCVRTPAVVSAHPGFADRFEHRHNTMLFEPGDVGALTTCINELLGDSELYAHISAATAEAWHALHGAIQWGELFGAWLTPTHEAWLARHALAATS
jgi:glycosyltransferase involved in cell wall biosynthesis